jgi:ribosome-binding factor A
MVSVTGVDLSPDGSVARVSLSVLPADRASLTLSGVRAAKGFLRRRVMDETRIPRVPRLEFELDDSIKRQAALDDALRRPDGPTENTTR